MKAKEIEALMNAYNRLVKQTIEDKECFGLIEIALRISDKDTETLRPFLRAKKKVTYSVGDVELSSDGTVYSAELTEGDTKYLIFPNERVLYGTLYDLREMIEHVAYSAKRIKADHYYTADTPQTDFPTEWCETCELWQDNNCKGIAECKRNIEMLKELNKLYEEADTPQTESTGSPIGDYRDGVGAWQMDCPWK